MKMLLESVYESLEKLQSTNKAVNNVLNEMKVEWYENDNLKGFYFDWKEEGDNHVYKWRLEMTVFTFYFDIYEVYAQLKQQGSNKSIEEAVKEIIIRKVNFE